MAGQLYKQTTEFVYLGGAISESADLDTESKRRIGELGRLSENTVANCTTDRTPGCAQDQAIQSGGNGSYAVQMCHVDYALSGF